MVGLVREATTEERLMFFRWLCGGREPVAPHLLKDGLRLQVDYDGLRLVLKSLAVSDGGLGDRVYGQAHYIFNPVLIGSELKAKDSEAERDRRERDRKPGKGRQK